jgi:endonuclease III
MANGFEIDESRLIEIMRLAVQGAESHYGIFREGLKRFLPQWNLPPEIEYSPQRLEVAKPDEAAKFLFCRVSIDRISVSRTLQRQALATWANPEKQWIFRPEEVVRKGAGEIAEILREDFYYAVPVNRDISAAVGYRENALVLVREYNGDPRNLIQGKTVEQARKELIKLRGIGSGIANLYVIELASRRIALPTDPENIRPKIDRHKARIPLNTDAVRLLGTGEVHANSLAEKLEEAYVRVAQATGLNILDIDTILWVIGSELCAAGNYCKCLEGCPLFDRCSAKAELSHETGMFRVFEGGRRVDDRKNMGQLVFKF